jgi:hypothetical protein
MSEIKHAGLQPEAPSVHPVIDGKGERKNAGKPQYSLVPTDALHEMVLVFMWGLRKYAPRNWERGMNWSICYDSMMRHTQAWFSGEDRDPESGLLHTAHIAVNAMFLVAYQLRGMTSLDDREHLKRREVKS